MSPPGAPRAALALAAAMYGVAVGLRNRYYDRPAASRRIALPVISVGNLTSGGTGKTPLVAWLAHELLRRGQRPAIVSRGYGGRAGRGPLFVSRGAGPLCAADLCGDEPHLLAASVPGAQVVVGADRVGGAEAAGRAGASVVLLDDGFQHRRLARDLDIVLLDATDPFGGNRLLPAGRLREPLRGLARADLLLITRSRAGQKHPAIEATIRAQNTDAPILLADHRVLGFFDAAGARHDAPERAVAFCGIGNPDRFRDDLRAAGVELLEFRARRDHHRFSIAELQELGQLARAGDAHLVTTEKDVARLGGHRGMPSAPPLLALRIEARIHEPRPLLERLAGLTA